MDGILEKTDAGWHCAICDETMGSAAGFYYHLYGCMTAAQPWAENSTVAEELAELA